MSTALELGSTCTGVIGVGNMGEALLAGLLHAGIPASNICFSENRDDRAAEISARYGATRKNNREIAQDCQVILLVTKPQDLGDLLEEIAGSLGQGVLLISFAAGKSTTFIESAVSSATAVIRVMPNTPALIGKGAAGISAGSSVSAEQMKFAIDILTSSSEVVRAGTELGLTPEIATALAVQTMYGAAGMLKESGKNATTLRENVTSPNGTTAAALKSFADGGLEDLVLKAMTAARDRSQELA